MCVEDPARWVFNHDCGARPDLGFGRAFGARWDLREDSSARRDGQQKKHGESDVAATTAQERHIKPSSIHRGSGTVPSPSSISGSIDVRANFHKGGKPVQSQAMQAKNRQESVATLRSSRRVGPRSKPGVLHQGATGVAFHRFATNRDPTPPTKLWDPGPPELIAARRRTYGKA